MLGLIAIVTAAVVKISSGTLRTSGASEDAEAAYRAAETGAELALLQLKYDNGWTGFGPTPQDMPGGAATYQVHVFVEGESPGPDHGVVVPPQLVYVQSTGISRNKRVSQVGLMVKPNSGVLDYAAVVQGNIELLSGSVVESRNPQNDEVLSAAATVVSNSTSQGAVKLDGGSQVNGMARPGPGAGGDSVEVLSGSEATMGYSPLSAEIPIDPVILPTSADIFGKVKVDGGTMTVETAAGTTISYPTTSPLPPGTYGELEIVNGSLTLITGNYVFDKIKMQSGRVEVLVGDAVEFYSKGEVEILDSSFVNDSKTPANMKFHVQTGDVKLDLSDGGAAYYILDAPNSNVELLSGSRQYGNLIANNLKLDDASLYFDPAAGGALNSGGSTTPTVKSFQRF
jgi:hypothetical protein